MQTYPQLLEEAEILQILQKIIQLRNQEDVQDFNTLATKFVSGRTTTRIPSSAADVVAGDRIGDTTNDDTYLYLLVNTTGGPLWNRMMLDTGW